MRWSFAKLNNCRINVYSRKFEPHSSCLLTYSQGLHHQHQQTTELKISLTDITTHFSSAQGGWGLIIAERIYLAGIVALDNMTSRHSPIIAGGFWEKPIDRRHNQWSECLWRLFGCSRGCGGWYCPVRTSKCLWKRMMLADQILSHWKTGIFFHGTRVFQPDLCIFFLLTDWLNNEDCTI